MMPAMKLNVLESENDSDGPWYVGGLKFTCTVCGNCCTGGPGYVWVTKEEIVRLAGHLKLTPAEVVERYCRRVNGKLSFKERRMPNGEHDCIFLQEIPAPAGAADGKGAARELAPGEPIPVKRRGCSIYEVRPLQCRTWPFWPENLASQKSWDRAARRCHGMNHGRRQFTAEQVEAIRDAADWPENPPSSAT